MGGVLSVVSALASPVTPIIDSATGIAMGAADTLGVTYIAGQAYDILPAQVLPGGIFSNYVSNIPNLAQNIRNLSTGITELSSSLLNISGQLSQAIGSQSINSIQPRNTEALYYLGTRCGSATEIGPVVFQAYAGSMNDLNARGFKVEDWYIKPNWVNVSCKLCYGKPDVNLYTFGPNGFATSLVAVDAAHAHLAPGYIGPMPVAGNANWTHTYQSIGSSLDSANRGFQTYPGTRGSVGLLMQNGPFASTDLPSQRGGFKFMNAYLS